MVKDCYKGKVVSAGERRKRQGFKMAEIHSSFTIVNDAGLSKLNLCCKLLESKNLRCV